MTIFRLPDWFTRWGGRKRLPNRQTGDAVEFEHGGQPFIGSGKRWISGRYGAVFLNSGRPNSQMDVIAQDSAIAASFALQHGADFDEMRKAFLRDEDGSAAGPLGHLFDLLTGAQK